jgi:hypothetical protein
LFQGLSVDSAWKAGFGRPAIEKIDTTRGRRLIVRTPFNAAASGFCVIPIANTLPGGCGKVLYQRWINEILRREMVQSGKEVESLSPV